ncbi:MAG: hypothetical protein WDO72_02005 [Pseudomonadota bacterium]
MTTFNGRILATDGAEVFKARKPKLPRARSAVASHTIGILLRAVHAERKGRTDERDCGSNERVDAITWLTQGYWRF